MDEWLRKYEIAKKYKAEFGNLFVPDKYHYGGINLGNWIYWQRKNYRDGKLSEERRTLLEKLGIVWEKVVDYNWDENYQCAIRFKDEFNTLMVPSHYVYEGRNLGRWISHQRQAYKRGSISPEKIKKLEAIGIVWDASNNSVSTSFPEQALFYYIRQSFGDAINRYKDLGFELDIFIPSLGTAIEYDGFLWHKDESKDVMKNIDCLRNGIRLIRVREEGLHELPRDDHITVINISRGYPDLSDVIVKVLHCLGVNRNIAINLAADGDKITRNYINVYNDYWNKMYALAKKYYLSNHSLTNISDSRLDAWVKYQRQRNKGYKSPLTKEQFQKLEAIGMKWDVRYDHWKENYALASSYFHENGNLRISNSCVYRGVPLGSWIATQREAFRSGKLTASKKKKLDSIGMVWDVSIDTEKIWNDYYSLAKLYYREHGNLELSIRSSYRGVKLGQWINRMRTEASTLPQEKIDKLNSIGMVWNVYEKSWDEHYALLLEYYKRNGNILVHIDYKEKGLRLGWWLHRQASNRKSLSAKRVELLERLGITWERRLSKWDDMYETARRFYEKKRSLVSRYAFPVRQ